MAADLIVRLKTEIKAAIAYVIDKAGVVYIGSTENVQTVLDFFNTHDLNVGGVWYRYIGEVETSEVEGFTHQFGRLLDEDGPARWCTATAATTTTLLRAAQCMPAARSRP